MITYMIINLEYDKDIYLGRDTASWLMDMGGGQEM